MAESSSHQAVIEWLKRKGHTQEEIEKIMKRLRQYDRETNVDSVMDSIAAGTFNLQQIVDEALGND